MKLFTDIISEGQPSRKTVLDAFKGDERIRGKKPLPFGGFFLYCRKNRLVGDFSVQDKYGDY